MGGGDSDGGGGRGDGARPGGGVVLGPDPLELVEVVGAEDGPVARQVVEVVHDDGHEEVDDLGRGARYGAEGLAMGLRGSLWG